MRYCDTAAAVEESCYVCDLHNVDVLGAVTI